MTIPHLHSPAAAAYEPALPTGSEQVDAQPERAKQHWNRAKLLRFERQPGVRQVSVLSELKVGESGVLVALDLPESVQNHLMHMGFVPDALVTALRRAPAGDPTVYAVDGMEIALRRETAEAIRIKPQAAENEDPAEDELIEAAQ